eukprot:s2702_g9.t1
MDATLKDVALNPEALLTCHQLKRLGQMILLCNIAQALHLMSCALAQVVFAIMSVNSFELRLSEEMLAKAILDFYTTGGLVPDGISVEALDRWAAKMAHGARKVTSKFRRLYSETPDNSKNVVLRDLKARCQAAGIRATSASSSSDQSLPASHEDLEEIHQPQRPAWVAALQSKLLARAKSKAEAAEEPQHTRPVATPSRSHHVPKFVLEKLNKETPSVEPFVTKGTEVDDRDVQAAAEKKQKKPATAKSKTTKKSKGGKKKKPEITGEEVEAALQLEEPAAPQGLSLDTNQKDEAAEAAKGQQDALHYSPRKFNEARKAYVADQRKSGLKYHDALASWMRSDLRASYLETVPFSQMKRRRFASSGSHERSILFPFGNAGYDFVRCGNALAARVCLLAIYSLVKGCWFIIEQPQGSCAQLHPRISELLQKYDIFMSGIWGGKYGIEGTAKRHWLYSSNRSVLKRLAALAGHMTKEEREALQGGSLVKRVRRADGSWSWTYHQRFGSHLAELLKEMGNDEHEARQPHERQKVFSAVLAEALPKSPVSKEKHGVMEKSDYELFKAWLGFLRCACKKP